MVLVCLPLAAPTGLSPLHIPTLCGSERAGGGGGGAGAGFGHIYLFLGGGGRRKPRRPPSPVAVHTCPLQGPKLCTILLMATGCLIFYAQMFPQYADEPVHAADVLAPAIALSPPAADAPATPAAAGLGLPPVDVGAVPRPLGMLRAPVALHRACAALRFQAKVWSSSQGPCLGMETVPKRPQTRTRTGTGTRHHLNDVPMNLLWYAMRARHVKWQWGERCAHRPGTRPQRLALATGSESRGPPWGKLGEFGAVPYTSKGSAKVRRPCCALRKGARRSLSAPTGFFSLFCVQDRSRPPGTALVPVKLPLVPLQPLLVTLPSNRCRLSSNRHRLPSNRHLLPSNRCRLPSNRHRLTPRPPSVTLQALLVTLQPSNRV